MMTRRLRSPLSASLLIFAALATAQPRSEKQTQPQSEKQSVYDFSLVDQSGKVVSLSDYKGKVLLIVNLASQSEYNTQIAELNELEKTYGPRGLVVLGIPSSDFGGQELKEPAALEKYYSGAAKFPVFARATLTGVNEIPLYQFLCDPKQSVSGGELRWNYTKFLIDRDGKPLARYEVDTDPADLDFKVAIESALAGKFKKKPAGKEGKSDAPGGAGQDPEGT